MPGDVLVERMPALASGQRYLLRRHPGEGQFTFATYESAIRMARGFAEHHHVDLWYAEQPGSTSRIASYRSPELAE